MLIKILIGLGAIIALILIIAAFKSPDFVVTRSATIQAPATVVFAQVNDFKKWPAWSPYEKIDPAMKKTLSGAPTGTGAIQEWQGNSQAGEGRITITESQPSELIRMRLEMFKPFPCDNQVEFTFASQANQTTVTWSMSGKTPYIGRIFCLFISMDKMAGGQFEEGLAQLKKVSEASTAAR
ncbi:SRPBCC family protein [Oleiharenicola lentus]|uniref:SRPBCC family protein n=1 Tax=Oleiharenicola lentus TaxID=2508720 RepID=UPI003F6750C6